MWLRKQSRKIVKELCRRLDAGVLPPKLWHDYEANLYSIQLTLVQRRCRICDSVILLYEKQPVWLPIWQRLRLRRAMRRCLAKAVYSSLGLKK